MSTNTCINLRTQETEKLSSFCRITSLTKKDVVMAAVRWQLENLNGPCLTYMKSSRRTAYIRLDGEEVSKLNQLADILNCTQAQAGLIAVRNFSGADQDGEIDFFKNAELAEVPEAFMIAVPANVVDAMKAVKGSMSGKIRDALNACDSAENLPPLSKRANGFRRINIRAYLPKSSDRELLQHLMGKHNDGMSRVLARCLMLVHLYRYGQQVETAPLVDEDLELF